MDQDARLSILRQLHEDYVNFIQKLIIIPGAPVQKQQAIFRFDEGHMWMQNAISSYEESQEKKEPLSEAPQAAISDTVIETPAE